MKILIFNWRDIKNPRGGGAEILTHEMAMGLVKKGHEVVLFTSSFKGAQEEEFVDGVKIIRAGGSLGVYWQAFRYYAKRFKGKFDIVIDEINTIPFFTPLYVKEKVVSHINQLARRVWFYESVFPISLFGYLSEFLLLKLYRHRPSITISKSTRDDLVHLGFNKDNVFIIPMGIDFEPLDKMPEKEARPTMIYVGRLKRSKRVHHIISAFKMIKQNIDNCCLWIVGNGDEHYKRYLKRLAGQRDDIKFFEGASNEKKLELMRRAHLIVVTSVREGWGLIVTEANAMGTPAVVYSVPGLKDSVKDGINGLQVEDNTPYGLADTIIALFKDRQHLDKLSQQALEDAGEYHWIKTVEETEKILFNLYKQGESYAR